MKVRKLNSNCYEIDKNTEIERANRILLEKITKILKSKHIGPKDAAINFQ